MRVLFVSSEVFPLVKTGGLADVSGALPAALTESGEDVKILLPGYPEAIKASGAKKSVGSLGDPFGLGAEVQLLSGKLPDSGVPVWLVDCPALFERDGGPYQDLQGRDWPDNALRFALLSWTAAHLCTEHSPVKWRPQVLHANDWQAGLAAAYLQAWNVAQRPATVFTIHNIAYQGQFPPEMVARLGFPPEMYAMEGFEYYDTLSFLKAGLFYSDRITTVSPRYAKEIQTPAFGCGMDGLLSYRAADLTGILNGADYQVWNPATDPHLDHPFAPGDAAGKARNKAALQAELGLAQDPDAPLMVIVSRLNDHKGMDLVLAALPNILRLGAQVAVVGTGDRPLEDGFRAAAAAHPAQVAARIGYSEPLAHRMMAGGDMLLMPSRFEPCGLTQFYAFRYGTVPVAHATGGLADTLVDTGYDTLMTGKANGFVFEHCNAGAFQWAVERAVGLYAKKDQWTRIVKACNAQDFGWSRSAALYRELYKSLAGNGKGKKKA
ncbi:Glycogen synthase ADP-glucose transglucosylase [Paramagnetospirillum magnetotacticum MS-1]|uniref:Glycogen synthase n=1 Tax=Paramagnetospirillum magnetotacticum MS-1 TaxID=272627 RepID=A0A0C2YV46_PARME|nr:glycogen synthase GlgA [Paramagnetospirillum magnetotacticum]KIL98570.1 Glycogen synthase ADP-glucose transglucosylase [Paramagnetospirillum magnetotacticum MS-1]